MFEFILVALIGSAGASDWTVAACDGARGCVERRVELVDPLTLTLAFERSRAPHVEVEARRLASRQTGEAGVAAGEGRFTMTAWDRQGRRIGGGAVTLAEGYAPGTLRTHYGFLRLRALTVEIAPGGGGAP